MNIPFAERPDQADFPSIDDIPAQTEAKFLADDADIACTDCGQQLGFAELAEIKVAACSQCQGMLVQREFLWPIIERCRHARTEFQETAEPLDLEQLDRKTACPVCREWMNTFAYSGPSCVVIDTCDDCDVIWLNGGELPKIVEAPGL